MARCIVFSVCVVVLFGSACASAANPEPTLAVPAQTSVAIPTASADPAPSATTPPVPEQVTAVPEPTSAPAPTLTPTPLECLASWSVEEQIAQLLFPLVEQFQLSTVAELAADAAADRTATVDEDLARETKLFAQLVLVALFVGACEREDVDVIEMPAQRPE